MQQQQQQQRQVENLNSKNREQQQKEKQQIKRPRRRKCLNILFRKGCLVLLGIVTILTITIMNLQLINTYDSTIVNNMDSVYQSIATMTKRSFAADSVTTSSTSNDGPINYRNTEIITNNDNIGMNNNNNNNTRTKPKSLGPILGILRNAGIKDRKSLKEMTQIVPDWNDVIKRFGSKPKIIGLETCKAYNDLVKRKNIWVGIAGPFNSGTNFVHNVLKANCKLPHIIGNKKGRHYLGRMFWQVNWGKHQSPKYRFNNSLYPQHIKNATDVLPIVIVRDPYSWMQSMCRNNYMARWYHVVPHHCPNIIPNYVDKYYYNKSRKWLRKHYSDNPKQIQNIVLKANFSLINDTTVPIIVRYNSYIAHHKSLIHMWMEWYNDYYYAKFPRIMIRLEDVVFHPRLVIKDICECVGGYIHDDYKFNISLNTAKFGPNHGKDRTGLIDAMIKHTYGDRLKGMTKADLKYIKNVLSTSDMMNTFNYTTPTNIPTETKINLKEKTTSKKKKKKKVKE